MENFIYGSTLLAMLSSEKSIAYWEELNIPIPRNLYKRTNQFARGCLELFMFSHIKNSSPKIEIQKSWESYSLENSILKRETLLKHQLKEASEFQMERIFYEVGEILVFENIEEIHKWSKNFFRTEADSIVEFASRLKFLLNNSKDENYTIKNNIGISTSNLKKVQRFCNQVIWRNRTLQTHFSIANNVYKMTLPDEWEMLLQDFFFEGARGSYWWMDSVEYSLQYINFYTAWRDLKSAIGGKNINLLFRFLESSEEILSDSFFKLRECDVKRLETL